MPTLEEIRRWARGESVDGLPPIEHVKPLDKPQVRPGHSSRKYKLNADATDALLLFGTFHGQRISALVATPRGRKYIDWILDKEFDDELKAVCRYQRELYKRDK